jgi:glycogen debranching enzyme
MFARLLPIFMSIGVCVAAEFAPAPNFSEPLGPLTIVSLCAPERPWTVAGEHGALLGRQDGHFEAWQWPTKLLSNFRIHAELAEYPVPIDVNALSRNIQVTPAETVITYSHAAFTVRQHMFSPRGSSALGAVVFFEVESARPLELTFDFTPEMLRMWPAPNFGRPSAEWVKEGQGGFYILHTDDPDFSGIVAMPHTRPGILPPYQEHPQTYPVQLKLTFNPQHDAGLVYPLVMALKSKEAPDAQIASLYEAIPRLYRQTREYYVHFFDTRLTIESPDRKLNEALQWAEVAIDQAQVQYHSETGLVAGYYESADSARPGYAWFFGRDTLFSTYAINGYGDLALTRKALDFLIRRQRSDGKIMHEFSQSADAIDWKKTPYFYAAADATPLFVMAMSDYVKTSGDIEYLRKNWDAVQKAYQFTRSHDSDGDGIYENTEGTGWVESWPPGMPHQEIYLAALDQQSAQSMAFLAGLMKDTGTASSAQTTASNIRRKLESEYYEPEKNFYAFSRNANGTLDSTASIYPSLAWWDGTLSLSHAQPMLNRWASAEFSTDWGTRDISPKTSFYDPISYHQGSVWPLFTGWVSVAEYRAGHPLSGYAHLRQNAGLTWAQDLGSVTELLSGEFFQPLGRSSSHQLWSSAMVITPLLRGLFGLRWDAPHNTLQVNPALPADWKYARLHNLPFGQGQVSIDMERQNGSLHVQAQAKGLERFCLTAVLDPQRPCVEGAAGPHSLTLPGKPVEIGVPQDLPLEGAETAQLKILGEEIQNHRATFTLAAMAGSRFDLPVRVNRPGVRVSGGQLVNDHLHIIFPNGTGYQIQTITCTW